MSKIINLQFEDDLVDKSESLLDDIGLDCQTFIKMCFKKLNKEKSISFLMTATTSVTAPDANEQAQISQPNMEENFMQYPVVNSKKEITAQMRDFIWEMFKKQYTSNKKIDCAYSAKVASTKIGITQGSASIYFHILNNLVKGVPNKRTMKYDDLVVYLGYIEEQLPKTCITNAIKSLSESIPYWEEHLQGHFTKKVSKLVDQYITYKI